MLKCLQNSGKDIPPIPQIFKIDAHMLSKKTINMKKKSAENQSQNLAHLLTSSSINFKNYFNELNS